MAIKNRGTKYCVFNTLYIIMYFGILMKLFENNFNPTITYIIKLIMK